MSLEWRARSTSLAWSNPLAWWWSLLTLVSSVNIAVWFVLYRQLHEQPAGSLGSTSGIELMLLRTGSPGSTRGRDLFCGAVGDHPSPTRRDDGIGHHPERRVADRAVDPDRGMLLVVCSAAHPLSGQRH